MMEDYAMHSVVTTCGGFSLLPVHGVVCGISMCKLLRFHIATRGSTSLVMLPNWRHCFLSSTVSKNGRGDWSGIDDKKSSTRQGLVFCHTSYCTGRTSRQGGEHQSVSYHSSDSISYGTIDKYAYPSSAAFPLFVPVPQSTQGAFYGFRKIFFSLSSGKPYTCFPLSHKALNELYSYW